MDFVAANTIAVVGGSFVGLWGRIHGSLISWRDIIGVYPIGLSQANVSSAAFSGGHTSTCGSPHVIIVYDSGIVSVRVGFNVLVGVCHVLIRTIRIRNGRKSIFKLVLSESCQLSFLSSGSERASVEEDDESQSSSQGTDPPFAVDVSHEMFSWGL